VQQVQQQLGQQQQLAAEGFNLQELFKAKNQLQRNRNFVNTNTSSNQLGGFKKRIEKGITIESQRANNFLPSMSNIAITLGYKITKWATVGMGFSCKVGWGQPVKNINVTMQGMGARVYGEVQWKKSIWATASLERNHFSSLSDLQFGNITPTQYSALLGISKKIPMGKKNQSIQLLWDALAYKQIPRAEPFKFRINYQF
jgi:hypothetical protein